MAATAAVKQTLKLPGMHQLQQLPNYTVKHMCFQHIWRGLQSPHPAAAQMMKPIVANSPLAAWVLQALLRPGVQWPQEAVSVSLQGSMLLLLCKKLLPLEAAPFQRQSCRWNQGLSRGQSRHWKPLEVGPLQGAKPPLEAQFGNKRTQKAPTASLLPPRLFLLGPVLCLSFTVISSQFLLLNEVHLFPMAAMASG